MSIKQLSIQMLEKMSNIGKWQAILVSNFKLHLLVCLPVQKRDSKEMKFILSEI
jgi:hypothetical protein